MTLLPPSENLGFVLAEDNALKTLLQGLTVSDEKNQSRPVQVWFANPDVESRQQSYPYITIELIDTSWAGYRQHSGVLTDNDNQGTQSPEEGKVYTYEMPTTWDLTYQVTTYARHPRHDRIIMSQLLTKVFDAKRAFIPVYNELNSEYAWRHLTLEDFAKRDIIEDGRRLFRNVFTVTITSEQPGTGAKASVVENVSINNDPTYVPDDLQTP